MMVGLLYLRHNVIGWLGTRPEPREEAVALRCMLIFYLNFNTLTGYYRLVRASPPTSQANYPFWSS